MSGQDGAHLAILGKINLKSLGVVLKPERGHRKQNILAVDGLTLLLLAFLRSCSGYQSVVHTFIKRNGKHTLTSDERDELAHAFLHALLGFLCYLRIIGQSQLHDTRNCIRLILAWSVLSHHSQSKER